MSGFIRELRIKHLLYSARVNRAVGNAKFRLATVLGDPEAHPGINCLFDSTIYVLGYCLLLWTDHFFGMKPNPVAVTCGYWGALGLIKGIRWLARKRNR